MIEKKWQYKNKEHKPEKIREVAKKYSIPSVIAAILLNRSVEEEDIPSFFSKSMQDVINPMEMKDMDKAVERIIQALQNGEPVMVYGD